PAADGDTVRTEPSASVVPEVDAKLVASDTFVPPLAGALPSSVMVPIVDCPPATPEGEIVNARSVAAFTVRFAVAVSVASLARIVTVIGETTPNVCNATEAERAPAGMVMAS